ncbi:MAG: long-chain-acyl-CoA synthetase [Steroidobacteraceae bacterium]|nr:long-chain-acyl-CoA synthetase [Steroidobacteraceae bacterium]MBP7012552.1 long-chain-acyl-CoA synthetase [Steroidobacteraceae bacterium]
MQEDAVVPREVTMQRMMPGFSLVANYRRDQDYTVADRIEERARDSADRPFIIFEGRTVTFGEMNALANRVAHAALSAGLQRGDVVALMMENRPEYPMVWLGLAKVGIIAALLNTSARDRVLKHALGQTRSRAIIFGAECAEHVATLAAAERPKILFESAHPDVSGGDPSGLVPALSLEAAMREASPENPDRSVRAGLTFGDPLYYLFTSGTTGLPKAAVNSHLRFVNAGEVIGGIWQLGPTDVLYNVLPLFHGAGGMVVISIAMRFGVPIVLKRKLSVSEFWNDVRRHQVTAMYYIGEICRYIANQPPRPDDRDHTLRKLAGAGLRPDIWRQFLDRFGVEMIVEGLGATEANYGISNVDNRIGSIGRLPYPEATNMRVLRYDAEKGDYVRNPDGSFVRAKAGEVGELVAEVLAGPGAAGMFEGYTSAEATEAKLLRNVFRPGDRWVHSGDLVRFDEDDYYYFVDRMGDTFRWRGHNVSTEEVAEVLGQFKGPASVNVYGVRVAGEEGRAGMVSLTYPDAARFDPGAFHDFAVERLATYAVPLFVRISREADLTSSFKLRKIDLQRDGYDPKRSADPLFVRDAKAGTYLPVTDASLKALAIAPFAGD